MVLVGVNVDHAELSKWAMRSFADYNAIPMKARPDDKAEYTGGCLRVESDSPFCHVALALESAPWTSKDIAPISLLQTMLGGGSRDMARPGADITLGTTSRLAQLVKDSSSIESCVAFNTSYTDSGLFGVYGVVPATGAAGMSVSMSKTLGGMTEFTADELNACKTQLKAKLHRQMEDAPALMQDIGQQLLFTGQYGSVSDFSRVIDEVTEEEVREAARNILNKRPTVVCTGDIYSVPSFQTFEAAVSGTS